LICVSTADSWLFAAFSSRLAVVFLGELAGSAAISARSLLIWSVSVLALDCSADRAVLMVAVVSDCRTDS
jgi:hypothetical protein